MALDDFRKLLYVANYGNSFSAFQIDDNGKIVKEVYNEAYGKGSNVVTERQGEAHPHAVYMWYDYVYVVDLGSDKIWRYRVTPEDMGGKKQWKLEKSGSTDTPKGWGPRHMAFHHFTAYVVFELETKIGVFQMDAPTGELRFLNDVSTVENKGK